MLRSPDFEEFAARDVVAVNTGSGAEWRSHSALVVAARPDELHLALRGHLDDPRALEALAPGMIVRVVRRRELAAHGQVIAKERHPMVVLIVRAIPAGDQADNHRAYHRVLTRATAVAATVTDGKAASFRVGVVDLSGGGARITGPRRLEPGSAVLLKLPLPKSDRVVEAPGRVVWGGPVRSLWQAGVRFERLAPAVQDAIVRAVLHTEIDMRRAD
jgi:hypothetical protein